MASSPLLPRALLERGDPGRQRLLWHNPHWRQIRKGNGYKTPYQNGTIKSDDSSTVLYEFDGLADGGAPEGGVVLGSDGYLYGTTMGGGGFDAGTIFKISRSGGPPQFKTIYSFGSVKITTPLSKVIGREPFKIGLASANQQV